MVRAESHHPPLVYENHAQDSRYTGPLDVAPTISKTYGAGGNNQPLVTKYWDGGEVAGTLTANNAGGNQRMPDKETDNQIRKWLRNPHTDSAEYRMWGNGCALPIVFYALFGIDHFAKDT